MPLVLAPTTWTVDDHDAATSKALQRANVKLAALRCVGLAGANGIAAAACLANLPPEN